MNSLRIIVDTNVWVDYYLPTRARSAEVQNFLREACNCNADILYPVHSLKDVFYLLNNTLKAMHREAVGEVSEQTALAVNRVAWSCIDSLCEIATAVGADESDVGLARKYRIICNDLEDNYVMAAAERAKADFIVTMDKQLLKKSTIPAYTPEDAIGYLQLAD